MPDQFADIARAFLAIYPSLSRIPDHVLYEFLAEHYPTVDLTAKAVARLRWSVSMLQPRPSK